MDDIKQDMMDFNFNQKKTNEIINSLDEGDVI